MHRIRLSVSVRLLPRQLLQSTETPAARRAVTGCLAPQLLLPLRFLLIDCMRQVCTLAVEHPQQLLRLVLQQFRTAAWRSNTVLGQLVCLGKHLLRELGYLSAEALLVCPQGRLLWLHCAAVLLSDWSTAQMMSTDDGASQQCVSMLASESLR